MGRTKKELSRSSAGCSIKAFLAPKVDGNATVSSQQGPQVESDKASVASCSDDVAGSRTESDNASHSQVQRSDGEFDKLLASIDEVDSSRYADNIAVEIGKTLTPTSLDSFERHVSVFL